MLSTANRLTQCLQGRSIGYMDYKQVRITSSYLAKLRRLAVLNKRSMARHLEHLIDKDAHSKPKEPKKD